MYEAGYLHIINNDISKTVIDNMNKIKEERQYKNMQYEVMDVTEMQYPNEYFDMVLDKSTLDALSCSDEPYLNVAKMLWHIHRVLKKGGVYVVISYSNPENRLPHLERKHVNFDIKVERL